MMDDYPALGAQSEAFRLAGALFCHRNSWNPDEILNVNGGSISIGHPYG